MNKKVLIAGIVVLLLLVGGYFFLSNRKTAAPVETSSPTSSTQKSLKDLLGLGTSQKCTFSSGTVYVASGKMRGDYTTTVAGKETITHMIVDGTTSYTWIEGEKTGYKMTFNPAGASAAPVSSGTGSSQTRQAPDLSQQADYNCSAWVADSSVFTPPTGVKFMNLGGETTSGSSSQCSVCDSLSGDDKTQCKAALGCK